MFTNTFTTFNWIPNTMPNKRYWIPVKRANLFVSSIHGKDKKTGFTIIHDQLHGWGFISKTGKSISWHNGRKPVKRKRSRKMSLAAFNTVLYPIIKQTFSPSLNISDLLKVQPMIA